MFLENLCFGNILFCKSCFQKGLVIGIIFVTGDFVFMFIFREDFCFWKICFWIVVLWKILYFWVFIFLKRLEFCFEVFCVIGIVIMGNLWFLKKLFFWKDLVFWEDFLLFGRFFKKILFLGVCIFENFFRGICVFGENCIFWKIYFLEKLA